MPPDGRPDEALMSDFARGDLPAFGELVARHRDAVVRFCGHMLGDRHAGEDAAQDAFVALFRCRTRYAPSAPFRALLYRLARNACADVGRRASRLMPTADPAVDAVAADAPADEALARVEGARVRMALARLTPTQREVLVLIHFQGLTYPEAASALGVPPGTVCSRAAAAYRALRRGLEEGIQA